MRILIVSHGHPALSAGGAERAAYSLFEHLKERTEVSSVCFVARAPNESIGHDANFAAFRGKTDELLISVPVVDHFTYQTTDLCKLRKLTDDLISHVKPDIVHIHHFVYFGLEIFRLIKERGITVVFTVHEYLLICNNYGQMVKTNGDLCHVSSPLECHRCFPNRSPGIFFLREEMIKIDLGYADALISPSKFLGERFAEWGFYQDAINVIENPLAPAMLNSVRQKVDNLNPSSKIANRKMAVGYFGQINKFKGVDVLLEAMSILPDEVKPKVRLGIHGANLGLQTMDFQKHIRELLDKNSENVNLFGSYDNSQVIDLMKNYDLIVVPSTWWENSPVVIQEAKLAGVQILCSNIGGMLEKANDARDSHFLVSSPASLARKIAEIALNFDHAPIDLEENARLHIDAVSQHIELYRELLEM